MPRTRKMQKQEKEKAKQATKKQSESQQKQQTKKPNKTEDESSQQQVVEVKKPKAKSKPKKYKKKTFEQQVRIQKSKVERIFLLVARRREDSWAFMVQGTKGNHYNIIVSTEVHCTCVDFRMKRKPCKHIYFIVTQVGQNDELLDYFKSDRNISKKAYQILDEQLFNRLKSRLEKPAKQAKDINLNDDKDCVICFSEMDKETESLQDCSTCKKYFHAQCLSAWKTHNPSCPLCRGALRGGDDPNDPLGKMIDIKI